MKNPILLISIQAELMPQLGFNLLPPAPIRRAHAASEERIVLRTPLVGRAVGLAMDARETRRMPSLGSAGPSGAGLAGRCSIVTGANLQFSLTVNFWTHHVGESQFFCRWVRRKIRNSPPSRIV